MNVKKLNTISLTGNKEQPCITSILEYDDKTRLQRARKAMFICFGAAFFSVFLPFAHFFLVPGFLLGAPFIYRWIFNQKGKIMALDGQCPNCQHPLSTTPINLEWPVRIVCKKCFEQIRIENRSQ